MITQGIWHQGNQVHNHKPCYTSDQIATQAKEKLAEFFVVLPPTPLAIPKPKARWKPPDARFVKINFNGAIFRTENKSRIGVVVRNHTYAILASLSQSLSTALQPAKIEAVVAARALEFGQEISISEADYEFVKGRGRYNKFSGAPYLGCHCFFKFIHKIAIHSLQKRRQ